MDRKRCSPGWGRKSLGSLIKKQLCSFRSIVCIWVVVLLTALPVTMCHGVKAYYFGDVENSACIFQTELGYDKFLFHLSFFLTSAIIPLSLISILYVGMLTRLWRGAPGCRISAESRYVPANLIKLAATHIRPYWWYSIIIQRCANFNVEGWFRMQLFIIITISMTLMYCANESVSSGFCRKGKRRVTRLVVVVVLVFAICWCPIQVCILQILPGKGPFGVYI